MVNGKRFHIRFTNSQFDRLKNIAHAKGFKTVSAYVRSTSLEYDTFFERKLDELRNALIGNKVQENIKDRPLTDFI